MHSKQRSTARRETSALRQMAADLPKFQAADAERFIRPDVHAGDRPSGASFATRSPALGLFGRRGHGASAGHADGHRDAEARRLRGGRGGGGQCRAGICGTGELRAGRRLLRVRLGSEGWQARRHGQLRPIAQSAHAGDGAGARRRTAIFPRWAPSRVSTPGALDGWWTLHQRYGKLKWAELFEPAIDACENGDPTPQIIGYYIKRNMAAFLQARLGRGRNGQCGRDLHAGRRGAQ